MVEVVGVRFHKAGHIYYYAPGKNEYKYKEKVLVEAQQAHQIATVAIPRLDMEPEDLPEELKSILHKASEKELHKVTQNEQDAQAALSVAKEKIQNHQLEMKLIKVEYTFDRSKMIFYFTADGRVDFRELVKDLAAKFRTRIELRQVGVRDEAKILGGIGPCGRQLCCTTFLGDFVPVSIKMAKDQGLSLNPTKISGLCGRLMCCLKYENEEYETAKKELPDLGKTIETPDGTGRVVGLNLLSRVVKVRLQSRETAVDYTYNELQAVKAGDRDDG